MRVVVLAAGRGDRLGPLGEHTPKGMLPVGGRPLVEWMIDRLVGCGSTEIVLVTGHCADMFAVFADRHRAVRTVVNADYADAGSVVSLAVGVEALAPAPTEDLLVTHADVLCESRGIRRLHAAPPGDVMLVSGLADRGDEVLAAGTDGVLLAMSKDPDVVRSAIGEVVGLSRFSGGFLADVVERARADPARNYEDVVMQVPAPVRYELVPDLIWGEVDDETQLQRMRAEIAPAVAAADRPAR